MYIHILLVSPKDIDPACFYLYVQPQYGPSIRNVDCRSYPPTALGKPPGGLHRTDLGVSMHGYVRDLIVLGPYEVALSLQNYQLSKSLCPSAKYR